MTFQHDIIKASDAFRQLSAASQPREVWMRWELAETSGEVQLRTGRGVCLGVKAHFGIFQGIILNLYYFKFKPLQCFQEKNNNNNKESIGPVEMKGHKSGRF